MVLVRKTLVHIESDITAHTGSCAKGPLWNNMLEEDKDEDDTEWSLGHDSQAQMQAIMQTHSLEALGHEDAAPGLMALAGDRSGKSPHAHPCYPA